MILPMFPILPFHHGEYPDVENEKDCKLWITRNIACILQTNHEINPKDVKKWIPQQFTFRIRYIKTLISKILNNEIGWNSYMKNDETNTIIQDEELFKVEINENDFTEESICVDQTLFGRIYNRKLKDNGNSIIVDVQTNAISPEACELLLTLNTAHVENIIGFYIEEDFTHLLSIPKVNTGQPLLSKMYSEKSKKYLKISPKHAVYMIKHMFHALKHLHSYFMVHTNISPKHFYFPSASKLDLVLTGLESCQVVLPLQSINDHDDFSKYNIKYLCPERVEDKNIIERGNYNDLSDVWSVGIIASELLITGNFYGQMTDDEIMEKLRSHNIYEYIPQTRKKEIGDLLSKILCGDHIRLSAKDCCQHQLFDHHAHCFDLDFFITNALLNKEIVYLTGYLRYFIAIHATHLPTKTKNKIAMFFGIDVNREITLETLKDLLIVDDDDEATNKKSESQLKKLINHFQNPFNVFNIYECVCFGKFSPHKSRIKFIHGIMGEFKENMIHKKDMNSYMKQKVDEGEIPRGSFFYIMKSIPEKSISKEKLSEMIYKKFTDIIIGTRRSRSVFSFDDLSGAFERKKEKNQE